MLLENPFPNAILVRMDKFFNEDTLIKQLSRQKCTIITNKPIKNSILQKFKQNITHIVYMIEEEDQPKFINDLRKMNLSANLISELDDETLSKKKINYMDYGSINQIVLPKQEDIEELKELDINSLYYLSNGPVIHNNKTFKSN